MAPPFRITNWRKSPTGPLHRAEASLDGTVVWFEGAALGESPESSDPFLAVALLAAMAAGRDLDLSEAPPVSPMLLQSLDTIQELWTQWNPHLSRIDITANSGISAPTSERHATCFSGGVDATHATLEGGAPGDLLVFINGFDFVMDEAAAAVAKARCTMLAALLSQELTTIRTNWITWRRGLHLSGALMHGGCLVAAGYLLPISRLTIPSSNSWARMTPWGTHPLADPLWQTERLTVRHWGNHRSRIEKIARLASESELIENLWVCQSRADGNCGHCPKCARTAFCLELTGGLFPLVPGIERKDPLAGYTRHLRKGSESVYIDEFLAFTREHDQRHTARVLARARRRLTRRKAVRDLVNLLFPERAKTRARLSDLLPWGYGPLPESQ